MEPALLQILKPFPTGLTRLRSRIRCTILLMGWIGLRMMEQAFRMIMEPMYLEFVLPQMRLRHFRVSQWKKPVLAGI